MSKFQIRVMAIGSNEALFRSEFRYGQFRSLIPLSASINNERVKSEFKDGILTLTLPKLTGTPYEVVKVSVGDRFVTF
jgi:HSP20 family protein